EGQLVEQDVRADLAGAGPPAELLRGDLLDQRAIAGDLPAAEGGGEQSPCPGVLVAVLQQQRVAPQDRAQQVVALTGVEDRRRSREHVLEVARGRDRHDPATGGREAERERHPVATGSAWEQRAGRREGEDGLEE